MYNLTNKFIQKLIKDTKEDNLIWTNLFDFTHHKSLEELPGFEFLFFTNEYHQFDYLKSYIVENSNFILLIIRETFISGIDGTEEVETNLYISDAPSNQPYLLTIDQEDMDELITSIDSQIKQTKFFLPNNIYEVIVNYLKDN